VQPVANGGALRPVGDGGGQSSPAGEAIGRHDGIEQARATEYLLLANLFRRAPNARLLTELSSLRGDASALGMAHLALADAARAATPESVAAEFFSLFIGVGRGEVMPFGSYYMTGFLHDRPLARVREDMARLGIERQQSVFEPEDHIASLLEVMAGLIGGELGSAPDEADKFFVRHIAPWAERLMADIAVAKPSRFYKAVAILGQVWIGIEQASMQLPR